MKSDADDEDSGQLNNKGKLKKKVRSNEPASLLKPSTNHHPTLLLYQPSSPMNAPKVDERLFRLKSSLSSDLTSLSKDNLRSDINTVNTTSNRNTVTQEDDSIVRELQQKEPSELSRWQQLRLSISKNQTKPKPSVFSAINTLEPSDVYIPRDNPAPSSLLATITERLRQTEAPPRPVPKPTTRPISDTIIVERDVHAERELKKEVETLKKQIEIERTNLKTMQEQRKIEMKAIKQNEQM